MPSAEALAAALSMVKSPQLTSRAREVPLPQGVTFLLQVAAGEPDAVEEACRLTDQTEKHLRKAAGFFVEQVLLTQPIDHYRVLGCNRKSSNRDLRRHMALMMKWLHPDVAGDGSPKLGFDKSLYANRVTEAWEALKTDERRAVYDRTLVAKEQSTGNLRWHLLSSPSPNQTVASETRLQIVPYRLPVKPVGFWTRIFSLFASRP